MFTIQNPGPDPILRVKQEGSVDFLLLAEMYDTLLWHRDDRNMLTHIPTHRGIGENYFLLHV
jgi:hypothetical protein